MSETLELEVTRRQKVGTGIRDFEEPSSTRCSFANLGDASKYLFVNDVDGALLSKK